MSEGSDQATRVFTLVRLFDKLEYAESFRGGKLRLRRISYFRKYTDAAGELRGDPYEGVGGFLHPSEIGSIKIAGKEILGTQLTEPVRIYPEREQSNSILCLWALTNAGFENAKFDSIGAMKTAIQLQRECYGLGAHLVFFRNAEAFLQQVHAAVEAAGLTLSRNLVKYYKPAEVNGFFAPEEIPFRKRETYAHQREYRIVVHTRPDDPQPFLLDVGDLSDICEIVAAEEFNDSLTFERRATATDGAAERTGPSED